MKRTKKQNILDLEWENLEWIIEVYAWLEQMDKWNKPNEISKMQNDLISWNNPNLIVKEFSVVKKAIERFLSRLNQHSTEYLHLQQIIWIPL